MNSLTHHPPIDSSDDPHSSSISEVDSLSDLDWLDISSNRESDDNHSVSSSVNDEHEGLPHSRRSSISAGSSRDGDVEGGWEGFVDDSADEAVPVNQVSIDLPTNSPAAEVIAESADVEYHPYAEGDVVEEQRVNDALDQSMISTLSASRSSSLGASVRPPTVQGSLRDLKLSFPDPLTSSRDELNASYEVASPTESSFSISDGDNDVPPLVLQPLHAAVDSGSLTTPAVPQYDNTFNHPPSTRYLNIVLYGSSPAIKWDFIDSLIEKVATGAGGHAIMLSHRKMTVGSRLLRIQRSDRDDVLPLLISITDRTEGMILESNDSSEKCSIGRPSLAVIYLPSSSSFPSATEYDFYLPILVRPPAIHIHHPGSEDVAFDAAHRIWDSLAIPDCKVLQLRDTDSSPILDSEDLDNVQPSHLHQIFELISTPEPKKQTRRFTDHFTPIHSLTLLALLSLVLGLIVNRAFHRSDSIPTVVVVPPTIKPWFNHSAAIPSSTDMAIIPSSLKDFALAVFNPPTTVAPTHPIVHRTSGRGVSSADCEKPVGTARDVIPLPTPSTTLKGTIPSQSDASISSLGFKITDSLSEYFDVNSILEIVYGDLNELFATLGELVAVIKRQTAFIIARSKESAESLGDSIQYRHDRARDKAKALKDLAEEVIASTGERIKGRARVARARAQALKEQYLNSASWSASAPRRRKAGAAKARKAEKKTRKRAAKQDEDKSRNKRAAKADKVDKSEKEKRRKTHHQRRAGKLFFRSD